jgi:hypothetical protein
MRDVWPNKSPEPIAAVAIHAASRPGSVFYVRPLTRLLPIRISCLIAILFLISPDMSLLAYNLIDVYKYGQPTISAGDFEHNTPWNLYGCVMRLEGKKGPYDPPDLVSIFLNAQLDESAHQALDRYMALAAKIDVIYSDKVSGELKAIADDTGVEAALVTNLNRIIRGPCIYEKKRFRDVELSPQTKELLKQNPQGNDLIRLNWLLLGDAYSTPSRNAIEADGSISGIFRRKESIGDVAIWPKKLSQTELQDIWVEFSPTNRITLADITEDKIKSDPDGIYYSYQFEAHKLVFFEVKSHDRDYPNYKEEKTVRIGSLKNKSSFKLPCSLEDFEKVFGKADEIDRNFMW